MLTHHFYTLSKPVNPVCQSIGNHCKDTNFGGCLQIFYFLFGD